MVTSTLPELCRYRREIEVEGELNRFDPLHFDPPVVKIRQPAEGFGTNSPECNASTSLVRQSFAKVDVAITLCFDDFLHIIVVAG